jgi:ribonuclease BN (tRNA processing enzyme)
MRPFVVTLGTAGGPRWWRGQDASVRAGIATAVVVGDATYLVDCGHGVGTQFTRAGLPLRSLRAVFLTHLHSDHTIDLAALVLFGLMSLDVPERGPVRLLGPGDRGMLPPFSPRAERTPAILFAEDPTPGTRAMFDSLMRAHATDLADRMLDSLRPSPYRFVLPQDIGIPADVGFHPNDNPSPAGMAPFEVYRDESVRVTATLVEHSPVAPAFAFRFDTASGSVTISGDTAPCDNLVRLAANTDLLLHEALDFDWARHGYPGIDSSTAAAIVDHHRKAHSSPEQAGLIATKASAQSLALHHLVPGTAGETVWQAAKQTFTGPLHVPDDLAVLPFGS